MTQNRVVVHHKCVSICICFLLAVTTTCLSADLPDPDQEFAFASGLIEIGFPDLARKVVDRVILLYPDQKDRAGLIQTELLIHQRKFNEAERLLSSMDATTPKAQAVSLALAKGYYNAGDVDKASKIYETFFDHYTGRIPEDPDVKRFYQEAAYQFGQMLEQDGDFDGAAEAYARVLTVVTDKSAQRRLQADQAHLYVELAKEVRGKKKEAYLKKAQKLCEDIQRGGLDIWFGQSVITSANIELASGNRDTAERTLRTNLDILKSIDKTLKKQGYTLSVSPMSGARYLLGTIYEDQANALAEEGQTDEAIALFGKALSQYYNVFAKYGDSDWGPKAGMKAQAVKSRLENEFGKQVNVDLGGYQAKAAAAQFRMAENLFRKKQWKQAANEYIEMLNEYPEVAESPRALGNLALAYAHLDDILSVQMIQTYLGERFSGNDKAALALLALGKYYFDTGNQSMYMDAYETYFTYFPDDSRAPSILFTLAGLRKKEGDEEAAAVYFKRIIERYQDDQYYTKALRQLAWGSYAAGDYANAIEGFQTFVKESQPGYEKAQAQFCLADSYARQGQFANALKAFAQLTKWLSPEDNSYSNSVEEKDENKQLLEKAIFQLGYCYARLQEPAKSVPVYRKRAVAAFNQFLERYPRSDLAPQAMSLKGAVQLELGEYEASAATFDQLAEDYPDSKEGRSALFSLISSAMEIGQKDQAVQAFERMRNQPGAYTLDEFSRVGQLMLDSEMNTEAAEAFDYVINNSKDREYLERALYGRGSALFTLEQYDAALESLETLMTDYPKSGLFYDAKFKMGSAYRETGNYNAAVEALGDVMKFADSPALIHQASYDLGTIQKQQGDTTGALASFQRVALLADPSDKILRPTIEKSILQSIVLYMGLQRYTDAAESCEQYVQLFPRGSKVAQVRKLKQQANIKAAEAAASQAVAAEQTE